MLSKYFHFSLWFSLFLGLGLPLPGLGQHTTTAKQGLTSSLTAKIHKGTILVKYRLKNVQNLTNIAVMPTISINGETQNIDFQKDLCGDVGRFVLTSKQRTRNAFSFAYSISKDLQESLTPPIDFLVTLNCEIPNGTRSINKRSALQYVFPDYIEKPITKDINLHLNEQPQKRQATKKQFPWISVMALGVAASSIPLYQESQRPGCKRIEMINPITSESYVETYNNCEQSRLRQVNGVLIAGFGLYLGNHAWQLSKRKNLNHWKAQFPTAVGDCK